MFRMPDETPFGIDQSLHGRPIIDYHVSCQDSNLDVSYSMRSCTRSAMNFPAAVGSLQGQPSMHDNLRLQRLVQQLASKVRKLMDKQGATDTELHESHREVMALGEATFREMSLQVNTAMPDKMQRRAHI